MRKATKRDAILTFIGLSQLDGVSFSDIQRTVVTLNGLNYDEMVPQRPFDISPPRHFRRYRGYWCDYLCGKKGILRTYCDKKSNGRYVLKQSNISSV